MVTIRPATTSDSEAIGLITVSASLSAFIGHLPEEHLDFGWRPEDSAEGWRATMLDLAPDQFLLVAELGHTVVGFVWAGIADTDGVGEIKGLYVLPTRQGEGIGRLLAASAVDRLERDHTATSLLIGCIKESPSCGFYRHLGGVEAFTRPSIVDRFRTNEVVFVWSDLAPLRLSSGEKDRSPQPTSREHRGG